MRLLGPSLVSLVALAACCLAATCRLAPVPAATPRRGSASPQAARQQVASRPPAAARAPSSLPVVQPSSAPHAVGVRSSPLILPPAGNFARFTAQLQALREGRTRRLRLSFWGDSHIAGEALPGAVRQKLQHALGDGGPGFVYLGRPWRSYLHLAARVGESGVWYAERLWSRYGRRRRPPRDMLLGVGGISTSARRAASAWVAPRPGHHLATAELHFLRQPRGGLIEVLAGGKHLSSLATAASSKGFGFARFELPAAAKQLELRTTRGEVRLYGVDLASDDPGVICDSFGINGARAEALLQWDERLMAEQLERLAPDLLVLAYGSNEVDDEQLSAERLTTSFDQVLKRMQQLAPQAACLVVGPPDQARLHEETGWTLPAQLALIVEVQRRVAARHGCAFWDQQAAMGGPGSIFAWVSAEPPLARPDHLHFYGRGYQQLAAALTAALLAVAPAHGSTSQPMPASRPMSPRGEHGWVGAPRSR